MADPLERIVARALGVAVTHKRPLAGGDICEAWCVHLSDGRDVFVKEHHDAGTMFEVESFGLRWLAEASALRTPQVLHACERALILEFIQAGPRAPSFDEDFGRGLARLHAHAPAGFGLQRRGVIASVPQDNTAEPDWATFYGARRLAPMLGLCVRRGRLAAEVLGGLDALLRVLPDRLGPPEPPARLHGDLWSGNVVVDERGAPVLVDPAVYGGHREVDLAMMRLFGGFPSATFAAYQELRPLAAGHEDRVELLQLYPVLVHVALFGGHYGDTARRIIRRYA